MTHEIHRGKRFVDGWNQTLLNVATFYYIVGSVSSAAIKGSKVNTAKNLMKAKWAPVEVLNQKLYGMEIITRNDS